MNRIVCSVLTGILFSLNGCTPIPIHLAPDVGQQRAAIKFDYDSIYPISTGQVITFEGKLVCKEPLPNRQRLFLRGRGNPLFSDVNANGTYVAAGKELSFEADAITSTTAICYLYGAFTPKAGASYTLKLSQQKSSCVLDVLEGDSQTPVQDFKLLACQ